MSCIQVAKKLVDSDFKNHRVEDPTKISTRQEQHIKKYAKDYFEKVVAQRKAHEKKKADRRAHQESKQGYPKDPQLVTLLADSRPEEHNHVEHGMEVSDDEGNEAKPGSGAPNTPARPAANEDGLKRKRTDDHESVFTPIEEQATPTKRLKSETPPPPPPPPPVRDVHESSGWNQNENSLNSFSGAELHDQQAMDSLGAVNIASSQGESPADEDAIPPPPPPPKTAYSGQAAKEFREIDHGLANVSMGRSPDAHSSSLESGFRNEGDEDEEGVFGLQYFPEAAKLEVGGGV